MKYKKPKLYRMFPLDLKESVCMNGNEAANPPSCAAGPEAAGGCASGAAASGKCLPGAAAGMRCESGAGFG